NLSELAGYVGVSSGAIIAASLANGITTAEMVRLFFIDDDAGPYPLTPGTLMRPAFGEYLERAARIPALVAQMIKGLLRDPQRQNWATVLSPLIRAIPTGVFDNRPFEHFL